MDTTDRLLVGRRYYSVVLCYGLRFICAIGWLVGSLAIIRCCDDHRIYQSDGTIIFGVFCIMDP